MGVIRASDVPPAGLAALGSRGRGLSSLLEMGWSRRYEAGVVLGVEEEFFCDNRADTKGQVLVEPKDFARDA